MFLRPTDKQEKVSITPNDDDDDDDDCERFRITAVFRSSTKLRYNMVLLV